MNRRWVCNDVWMDILPCFDHAQLGLKLALLSPRFDALVDKHFDGKTELTIWRKIIIHKFQGTKPIIFLYDELVDFPLPDRPLPDKIRFKDIRINYIDHSVLAFIRSNKQIWDRSGINLDLHMMSNSETIGQQPIWDVFAPEIWPIFATNIRHLSLAGHDQLNYLLRHRSPTILSDLNQLDSICTGSISSGDLFPDGIADFGWQFVTPAGQALTKWLHTPKKDGQPKRLHCVSYFGPESFEWVTSFKKAFLSATTSVGYQIRMTFIVLPIVPFELVNEGTNEKLTLRKEGGAFNWLLKRCPIGEMTATVQRKKDQNWDDNLNNVQFYLWRDNDRIGPLSPSAEEKADQSNQNVV